LIGSLHDFHDRLLSYGTTPLAVVARELLADLDKPASEVRAAANYRKSVFIQDLRSRKNIKATTRSVPNMPPPMYI